METLNVQQNILPFTGMEITCGHQYHVVCLTPRHFKEQKINLCISGMQYPTSEKTGLIETDSLWE